MVVLLLLLQVNSYPTVRGFTAIGTGGDDFVHAMVVAVESVIQQLILEVLHIDMNDYYGRSQLRSISFKQGSLEEQMEGFIFWM
ncbi:hypothetical protein QJS10_CPB12g00697 [Acorus calamus]|uniref:Uncharacterized protein n=1 Tax=Acorus calamus TaxID=4465 RepID=A0AAV9DQ60_ACOCL|nr:hypothetical protein QJS10_CPB12g00697 [Acorus calamus]